MKMKILFILAVITTVMSACGEGIHFVDSSAFSEPTSIVEDMQTETSETAEPTEEISVELPSEKEDVRSIEAMEETAQPQEPTAENNFSPTATPVPVPQPTAAPVSTPEPTQQTQITSFSYGAIPFDLCVGTDQWWQIDSSDSAYWATQENINSIRAAAGLPALSMDSGLSDIAGNRCKSFVEGGPFDHSGMVTKSEICAEGYAPSASAVCSAWQNSSTHYANIVRTDISRMGVACWFCEVEGSKFTYWTVTFE